MATNCSYVTSSVTKYCTGCSARRKTLDYNLGLTAIGGNGHIGNPAIVSMFACRAALREFE